VSLDHAGLRFRVSRAARQIQTQHERLRPIFSELGRALSRNAWLEAQTEIFRLEGALQAHFLLEENVVFPALRGLHPECSAELLDLEREHVRVRREIRRIVVEILDKDLARAAESLSACVDVITEHERREQDLLSSLEAEGAE
jgi:hypothetical protein